ncbi:uncharacterized protein F4807DRAFT_414362 [Annulohypoxylon truncatum]|uniref:uncharacterized protein n=1 Tax=Annulohypoxylon truncatum TaxID=327061 RepID=UPI002007A9E2|nr:uncharacterized protein F4807DRAFT_414362 [Annulohypoxylon truncatum]KAI1212764.1 hypothetical protein F4807DRAFT_414362 [Annulohypoxylon truncatum]
MSSVASSTPEESPGSTPVPEDRHNLVIRDKGKAPESLSKRKRTLTNGTEHASSRRRTREPESEAGIEEQDFDPDQSMEERRNLQRGYRDLLRDLHENNDEYLKLDSVGLHETLRKANELSSNVKQTTEAAIDSKLLVSTADASYRKTVRLTSGSVAQGVDVEEFVSKCITYMRLGSGITEDDAPELTSTQQHRRRPGRSSLDDEGDYDDEIGDEGDMFNWEHLGRFACLPHVRRPATPGFLLGPLSAEVKRRKITKRSAPFRPNNLQETRPEVLDAEAVQRTEKNDLTTICSKILHRLKQVQDEAQDAVESAVLRGASDEEAQILMDRHGLRSTGGIDLLKFVVNPHSFGQTVENMFYVSFLIRDGRIKIDFDDKELPTLHPVDREDEAAASKHRAQKQQAVFSIDMKTWRDIISTFNITDPIIEHRQEESHQGPGSRGWYN